MASDSQTNDDRSWLRRPLTDSADIARHYDAWAANYEDELVGEWRYDAPFEAARRLAALGINGHVLDVGCGVGLIGRALRAEGLGDVHEIYGVDLSEASLAAAKASGYYRSLERSDFNEAPLPFANDFFAAVICVGVLSYAWDPAKLILEMCRVGSPGSAISFTHRTDLWDEQNFETILTGLRHDGHFTALEWSEPMPYMPGNEDFADQIRVRYVSGRV